MFIDVNALYVLTIFLYFQVHITSHVNGTSRISTVANVFCLFCFCAWLVLDTHTFPYLHMPYSNLIFATMCALFFGT